MEAYTGFEPHVGEIRALRSFRIGPQGALYPLFSETAWTTGTNTARCRLPDLTGRRLTDPHTAPEPDCSCGFYAYGTVEAAAEYPHARHVLAIIACWGRTVAGTRGVRAQHARIEAIWISSRVPTELAAMLAARYPEIAVYTDKETMLAEHPLTTLESYENPRVGPRGRERTILRLATLAALVVGALPPDWIWRNTDARLIWLAELCFFLGAALVVRLTHRDLWGRGLMLTYLAVVLWLLAPFAGPAGVLLMRLPILQIAVLGGIHRLTLNRAASRFPAQIGSVI
ncbi:MAG: hypothetical protein QOF92_3409 [Pseudonocardiales bacterium]|nr:hypothetical protein [Pseudonocardiales bacterium]